MSGQDEAAAAAVGEEDAKTEAFLDAIGDPDEIRRRGEALSAEDEAEYLSRSDEEYEEEMAAEVEARRAAGEDVDGTGGDAGGEGPGQSRAGVSRSGAIRVRVPAGREPGAPILRRGPAPATGEAPAPPAEAAGAREDRAPPPGGRGGGARPDAAEAHAAVDRGAVKEIADVVSGGIGTLGRMIDEAVAEIKRAVPDWKSGDVAGLVESVKELGDQLRVRRSDEERRAEIAKRRWKWPLRGLAVAAGIALLVGGAAIQARWAVLDDPLNQWKEIVWDRHGMMIADCIDRAERRGGDVRCRVALEVR